jgi:hypothetical protein
MTSSYLVLTAPDGADKAHEKTRFIRDGFTVLGFLPFHGSGWPAIGCGCMLSRLFCCRASAAR